MCPHSLLAAGSGTGGVLCFEHRSCCWRLSRCLVHVHRQLDDGFAYWRWAEVRRTPTTLQTAHTPLDARSLLRPVFYQRVHHGNGHGHHAGHPRAVRGTRQRLNASARARHSPRPLVCAACGHLHAHLGDADLRLPHRVRAPPLRPPPPPLPRPRPRAPPLRRYISTPKAYVDKQNYKYPVGPYQLQEVCGAARPTTASPTTTRTPAPSSSSTRPSGRRTARSTTSRRSPRCDPAFAARAATLRATRQRARAAHGQLVPVRTSNANKLKQTPT